MIMRLSVAACRRLSVSRVLALRSDSLCARFFPVEGFEGEMSGDNVEVGVVGQDGVFRVLSASEVDDYLREVA